MLLAAGSCRFQGVKQAGRVYAYRADETSDAAASAPAVKKSRAAESARGGGVSDRVATGTLVCLAIWPRKYHSLAETDGGLLGHV